jgi:3-deoxy-D-manno-octulosonic-acid transferase
VVWIHTISVGETRAVIPLFERIKKERPKAHVYISTITETGHEEAKRSLPGADGYFYLPLDFAPLIQKAIRRIRPDLLILTESDFWLELLKGVRKRGGKTLLVNGKISERSEKGFARLPFFSRPLFSELDRLCIQNDLFARRFQTLGIPPEKITITGNLKFDAIQTALSSESKKEWQSKFQITSDERVITIGSTHEGEEKLLLDQLEKVWAHHPKTKIFLAPRHPERFDSVAKLLADRKIPHARYSSLQQVTGKERVLLIDTIGLLTTCFQLSECAIIGGSYLPGVGGHNIFEPIQAHIPVLFGPYMETQPDLTKLVVTAQAGIQSEAQELSNHLLDLLNSPQNRSKYSDRAQALDSEARGSADRTFAHIQNLLD